jgi:hypothetical protein
MIGYGVNKGIVPITLNEIFNRIATNKGKDIEYEVNASILEIYNEEIIDLSEPEYINHNFSKKTGINIREEKDG